MYYSQFGEDKLIEGFISKEKLKIPKIIIEIGAADVAKNSNSRFFIENMGFKGYLFEPNPLSYKRLVEYYRLNSNVRVENYAVSDIDGEVNFTFREDDTLSGIDPEGNVKVGARRLKNYLIQNEIVEKIGILSIDAEGHDSVILETIINDNIQPVIIIIEANSKAESERQQKILCKNYTQIFATGHGQFATRNILVRVFRKLCSILNFVPPLRPVNTIWMVRS